MTDELPVAAASPDIRPIVWRDFPLHYVIPAATGLLGVLLLLLGGVAAWFGGWWLATAFPIAIGSLFRDPRMAAVPVLVWALWLVIGAVAGPDAALANTPIPVAVVLAAVGAAGTYLAQRVIFPATDPEVIEAVRNGRTVPTLDDGAEAAPSIEELPVEDAEDLDPALVDLFEVAEEPEDEAADEPEATVDEVADEAEGDDEPEATPDDADDQDGAEATADQADDDTPDEPEATAEDADDESDAADDPLDEGQHVAEFAAITEADVEQAESGSSTPTATRPSKRRGKH